MSIRLMTLVWSYYPIGGGELILALAIADHGHDDGTSIYPGVTHLAHKTRQSERAVQYQLRRMEAATWLQPVRYLNGGKGKAREYRINAEWIRDPANFAPLKRVQSDTHKDAFESEKGCNSSAPQLPETSSESPTTSADEKTTADCEEVVVREISFPVIFNGDLRESAEKLLIRCPNTDKQLVLYEVAGTAAKSLLRGNGIGLLAKLVNEAIAGRFVPNHAVTYERQLQREADQHATREAEAAQESVINIDERRQLASARLAEIKAVLQPLAAKNASVIGGSALEDNDE